MLYKARLCMRSNSSGCKHSCLAKLKAMSRCTCEAQSGRAPCAASRIN